MDDDWGNPHDLGNLQIDIQWEIQDPIRPYFVGIFPYIGLKYRPYIW